MRSEFLFRQGAGRRVRNTAMITGVLALCIAVVYAAAPASRAAFWQCPFHGLTGLYCPGCGGQRALHALLHGRFLNALSLNAFAVLVLLPLAVCLCLANGIEDLGMTRLPRVEPRMARLIFLLGLFILFGVLRNMPAAPFSWMAP